MGGKTPPYPAKQSEPSWPAFTATADQEPSRKSVRTSGGLNGYDASSLEGGCEVGGGGGGGGGTRTQSSQSLHGQHSKWC